MSRRIEWKVFGSRVRGEFLEGEAAAREDGDAGVRFAGLSEASRDILGPDRTRRMSRSINCLPTTGLRRLQCNQLDKWMKLR